MSEILIANIGSYPRVGEDKDQQRHRRGYAYFEKKEISAHAFRDVEESVAQEIIREQLLSGLDQVTNGLISWHDPISHFCRNASGLEIAGLMRYFNTNFYYRVPVLRSKPRLKQPVIAKEFTYAQSISSKPVRAVLTGPVTLASHAVSKTKSFNKIADRVAAFTQLIKHETGALAEAGASIVQIDEPSLAQNPHLAPLARKALEQITAANSKLKIILALYFFPLAPLWKDLQSFPVHGLNLDFTCDAEALMRKLMDQPGQKEIGFGVLNVRTTTMESPEQMAALLRPFIQKNPDRACLITPSAGLEFLPRKTAFEKISLLSRIKAALNA